jgi:integrase
MSTSRGAKPHDHHDTGLLSLLSEDGVPAPVPTADALQTRLAERVAQVGAPALAEFAYLQKRAAEVWGAAPTAHFARVLRAARVSPKAPVISKWQKARSAVARLPGAWQDVFQERITAWKTGRTVAGDAPWSADYVLAVINALAAWVGFCDAHDMAIAPTGANLEDYARACVDRREDPVSERTATNYLQRIHAGYTLIDPGYPSRGCEFVIRDWRERSRRRGTPTKTGAQLITARAIYDLGFSLIDEARRRPMRGLHAAKDFRNGLILAVGTSLPERARAVSCLAFDQSLFLPEAGHIHIRLPASALKILERLKPGSDGRDTVFRNARLHAALCEYRAVYRPLFDDGNCVFPSMKAQGTAISEAQIGRLTGNLTLAAFGTRIPVHRLRDNVATDAAEHLEGGVHAASALLRHRDVATTRKYDHSEGIRATEAFGGYVTAQRSKRVDLDL